MYQEYIYEPSSSEVLLTKIVGNTLLFPYYKNFVEGLEFNVRDNILDYCSGSGIITKLIAKRHKNGFVTFSDVSERWLDYSKNALKGYSNTKSMRIKNINGPVGDELFEKVVVHFVIHDFVKEYQPLAINQIIKSTKINGIIYIREPTNYSHGISVYQLINLLESHNNISYKYKIKKIPIVGEVIDFICKKNR